MRVAGEVPDVELGKTGQAAPTPTVTRATPVRFEQVERRYGDVVALGGFDLAIEPGELLVLVGPSGSGKSTALRLLAGLDTPTSGRIMVGDVDVSRIPPQRRDVAMVFQDYALYPHLTAGENLAFGLRVRKVAGAAEAVERVAGQLGLEGLLDRYPDQLSGGQQQRVALARAMVRDPAVYLMDEPLSNLDAQLRLSARAEIVELQRRLGTTTVYVTHDQVEAMTMGDRVAVLADGRLRQVGAPQDVYDTPQNLFVAGFLGSPPMNLVPGGGVLGGAQGTVVGVRPEDLRVVPSSEAIEGSDGSDASVAATVALVESLGSETVLAVTCRDGTRLSVRVPPRSPLRPGDDVRLALDRALTHVFDQPSGRRMVDT